MSKFNKTKYFDLKESCREKLNQIEEHNEELYQDLTQQWWRLTDNLDIVGMRDLDKELTDILENIASEKEIKLDGHEWIAFSAKLNGKDVRFVIALEDFELCDRENTIDYPKLKVKDLKSIKFEDIY